MAWLFRFDFWFRNH